ncbi:MAG: TetR/AcrR family transcriptional regulator [Clostridiales bacterium]|nr:TetR/AcrR family transcriptional regulator [Clostridiales bacterium]
MPVDMKHTIAKAVEKLLLEKKALKLTVKDIVEECHITRQAFYYHFADIPDLLDWIITQKEEELDRTLFDCYIFISGQFSLFEQNRQADSGGSGPQI